MSKPVLSKITSINGLVAGQSWAYQPAVASGGPAVAWAATGLPNGITINATTGKLSGSPDTPGPYNVTLKARDNANVWSDPLIFPVGVETVPSDDTGAIRINIDLQTGAVYSEANPANTPLSVRANDRLLISVGLVDGGKLQPINQLAILQLSMKVNDDEENIMLSDGLFTKVGDYDSTRYVIWADFKVADKPGLQAAFDQFESPTGTGFLGVAQFAWIWYAVRAGFSTPQPADRHTGNFKIGVTRELNTDIRPVV